MYVIIFSNLIQLVYSYGGIINTRGPRCGPFSNYVQQSNRCRCVPGYHFIDPRSPVFGCVKPKSCRRKPNTYLRNGFCICRDGFVPENNFNRNPDVGDGIGCMEGIIDRTICTPTVCPGLSFTCHEKSSGDPGCVSGPNFPILPGQPSIPGFPVTPGSMNPVDGLQIPFRKKRSPRRFRFRSRSGFRSPDVFGSYDNDRDDYTYEADDYDYSDDYDYTEKILYEKFYQRPEKRPFELFFLYATG